ncbi:hypothetical protein N431DRAFT_504419 [Stipitochalara longipes BDJ]|nr:hypothetical protein N431DRAFT_504419 [Stipitochalara longipes BDJ]
MQLLLSLTAFFIATNAVLTSLEARGSKCYNSCSLSFVEALPFTTCDDALFFNTATASNTAPACYCTLHSGNLGCINKCCDDPDYAGEESSILANYCGGPAVAAVPTAAATTTVGDTPAKTTSARGTKTTSAGRVATATATKKPNTGSIMAPAPFVLGGILSCGLLFVGLWM